MVLELDLLQQLGNRRDFVGFRLCGDLARGDPFLAGPALTMWSAPSSFEASWDRRHVLPSIAISRFGPLLSVLVTCASQSWDALERLGLHAHQQSTNAIA